MNKFLIIIVILWIINVTEAQVAKCDYEYQDHSIYIFQTKNASYYKCDLDTRKSNYGEKLKRIDGEHLTGHSDADLKWIVNYKDNKLKIFSSIFCQKFLNLEVIDMSYAELESIGEDSLVNCKNLVQLFIDGNEIHELFENLFLNQQKLENLDLKENQINFLPGNIFHPLVKLEVLFLNNNQLQSMNAGWFKTLEKLKWLRMQKNQISEIPSKCFASLSNLSRLWLNDNKIQTLHSDSFDGLQNLQIITLHSNEISDLPIGVFTPLENLQYLSLSDNKLTIIHSDSFGIHNQLTQFYLQNNKVNAISPIFIDNTAISIFNMVNNICCKLIMKTRSEIKPSLKQCFDNYQPRLGQPQQFFPFYNQFKTSNLNICGKPSTGQGNVVGGTHIIRGSFPWIAALVTSSGDYFCGGTLVSSRKILTAAHCIQDKHTSKATLASEFLVKLGAHDLNNPLEVGRTIHAVESVNVHPDWNTFTEAFDADIAVLVLESEVVFNKFIQPICMPNSVIESVKIGTVVGFGKSEDTTKVHENIPKMLEIPIHSNEDCFFHEYSLVKLSSRRTFCGGTGTGIGVCRGDSGGGLIVNDGSAYYLRGIVSSSLIGGPYGCDLNAYSVFTDVTKYTDWINSISTSRT